MKAIKNYLHVKITFLVCNTSNNSWILHFRWAPGHDIWHQKKCQIGWKAKNIQGVLWRGGVGRGWKYKWWTAKRRNVPETEMPNPRIRYKIVNIQINAKKYHHTASVWYMIIRQENYKMLNQWICSNFFACENNFFDL